MLVDDGWKQGQMASLLQKQLSTIMDRAWCIADNLINAQCTFEAVSSFGRSVLTLFI